MLLTGPMSLAHLTGGAGVSSIPSHRLVFPNGDLAMAPCFLDAEFSSTDAYIGPTMIQRLLARSSWRDLKIDHDAVPPLRVPLSWLLGMFGLGFRLMYTPPGVTVQSMVLGTVNQLAPGQPFVQERSLTILENSPCFVHKASHGWHLVAKGIIHGSSGLDFLEQTRLLGECLFSVLSDLPPDERPEGALLLERDELSQATINGLCREWLPDVLWHNLLAALSTGCRDLGGCATWTNTVHDPERFMLVGDAHSDVVGMFVGNCPAKDRAQRIGVRMCLAV